jgi:hypothetical protein
MMKGRLLEKPNIAAKFWGGGDDAEEVEIE